MDKTAAMGSPEKVMVIPPYSASEKSLNKVAGSQPLEWGSGVYSGHRMGTDWNEHDSVLMVTRKGLGKGGRGLFIRHRYTGGWGSRTIQEPRVGLRPRHQGGTMDKHDLELSP